MENTEFDSLYNITTPEIKTGLEFAIKVLSAYEKESRSQEVKKEGTANSEQH